MSDIIPDSHANRLQFLQNLKQLIADNSATLTLSSGDVLAFNAVLDPLISSYQTLVDAEEAVVSASANSEQLFKQQNTALRALMANLRANPKMTDGLGKTMGIYTPTSAHDPSTIKPKIKAKAEPGYVRVTGSKDYAELINIYMRLLGTTAWILVGSRRKKLPFDDQTPLKVAATPEAREYAGRGVVNDEEVGELSDIVQVTFAG